MADFRKWFIAFAVLALMLGASTAYAQLPGGGSSINCTTTPSNPTIVRSEDETALMGDFVLSCVGGTPTPTGNQLPQFDVTLTLNAQVTSRLLGGGYIDALLVIDEAFPTVPFPANAQQAIGSPTGQKVCFSNTGGTGSVPALCNVFNGTFNTATFLFNGNPYNQPSASNIFVAHQASTSQVTWLGVPIDAPGTAGTRVLRMTNVRANACLVGVSSSLVPSAITAFISINGSNNVVISGAGQQTVAFVQQGLLVSAQNTALQQCVSVNATTATSLLPGQPVTAVKVTEGFAASFKRRIAAANAVSDVFDGNNVPGPLQNVPGVNYNSETALQPPAPGGAFAGTIFGLANAGTRILLVFNNVNNGVSVFVPQFVALTQAASTASPANPVPGNTGNPTGGVGWQGGFLELIGGSSDLNGNVNLAATPTTTFTGGASFFGGVSPFKGPGVVAPYINAVQLPASGGVATAVYEVGNADPFAQEAANIPIMVAYVANTSNNLPATGTATVTASFAPLSNVNTASSTAPIPRFCNKSTAANVWHIDLCTCNLLFPFVSNQSGFDTGVAIANTSLDTLNGVPPQAGTVTLSYYGNTTGGGAAPANQTSKTVNAGEELVFTLSSGGDHGIAATPGFQGYIIAQMQFQWCHGFAFISDVGAQKLAEGYLAIQLDFYAGAGLSRTAVTGEVQGH
ncbi:MAG: hypothetical protein LAP38_15560 [Acidobacteriia bacterium]|nr:hypothetical protein [Terriglobia bacterium]